MQDDDTDDGSGCGRIWPRRTDAWRDSFLAAAEAALATQPTDGETLESERLKARLGEMLLKHELLEQKITSLEGGRPLARRRWKR